MIDLRMKLSKCDGRFKKKKRDSHLKIKYLAFFFFFNILPIPLLLLFFLYWFMLAGIKFEFKFYEGLSWYFHILLLFSF